MLGIKQNDRIFATTVHASKGIQIGNKPNQSKHVLDIYSAWRSLDLIPCDENIILKDKGTRIRRDGDMITLSVNFEIINTGQATTLLCFSPLTPVGFIAAAGSFYSNTIRVKNTGPLSNIIGKLYIDPIVDPSKLFVEMGEDGFLQNCTEEIITECVNCPYIVNGEITFRAG